jgi:hypothetical protein
VGVGGNDLVGDLGHAAGEFGRLRCVESVSYDDEPVTVEDLDGSVDLAGVDDLEARDAVVLGEVRALRHDVGVVAIASSPADVRVASR